MDKNLLIGKLNAGTAGERLAALRDLKAAGLTRGEVNPAYVNNHIHTTYSFSPYSPTKAAYMAYASGLCTAGIMDHDSLSGAKEFIAAAEILQLASTIGIETRVNMRGTPMDGRMINNPDQKGIAYMALHGIPHTQIDKVSAFFAPYQEKRNQRNRIMSAKIAEFMAPHGIGFDFDTDVLPLTLCNEGGTATERTLCCALAEKIIGKFGKGQAVVDFLEKQLGIPLSDKIRGWLTDAENPHYVYDLLGALKGNIVAKFYVDADAECVPVAEFVRFGHEIGAIVAYAYLGDVAESVTGDKKAQKFEDDYLEELFTMLKDYGFDAIAYMPSRNSGRQLQVLRETCGRLGFFEISGEDINSSRQSFICPQLVRPEFAHLVTATWALIGHEQAATKNLTNGMFTPETLARTPDLSARITEFAAIGKGNR